MRKGSANAGAAVNWTLVGVIAAGVALLIVYKSSPKDSAMRKLVADAPALVTAVPERAKRLRVQWQERLEQAKVTFQGAKAESETSLLRQLNEAKKRGSLGSG